MKNDYKIGLVIGLLVLFLGVGYFIFRGPGKTRKPEIPTVPETPAAENTFVGETTATGSSTTSEFPPPSMSGETTPANNTVAVATAAPAAETVSPAAAKPAQSSTLAERVDNWSTRTGNENAAENSPGASETLSPRLADNNAGGTASSETVAVKPAAGSLKTPPAEAAVEWGVPAVESTTSASQNNATTVSSVEPVGGTTPSTYVVKPNDVGWYIAENVYGKGMGQYWKLIRQANPDVDMSNLKAGQVLKIPPLPENARQRLRDTVTQGTTFTDATGKNIYVTKSGDSFWTIAQRVYGKGYRYKEIQKANPGVETLRPGLRLVIPGEVVSTSSVAGEMTTYGSDTVTTETSAANYYTVKSGDSLWTIAEKEFGDGSYADLIKKANPNINANNLRVGQRIVLPAKPEGTPATSTHTSDENTAERRHSAPSSSEPVPSDEPDFGL
ncbi:MAG TPA: LysM peptidoglycan-binding domain-containing protein [Phycisphaerae bacterium]|nr:LysM peptidoglycan-binding domain-containing protein [Phycisphaerae bacterium]HPS51923.1 LysM peptidoglycan-binding domain-containing protein [Phycisphaerae bacterium]